MFWIFWEMTSGNIFVFSTLWFDSGYMSASVYETSEEFQVFYVSWWTQLLRTILVLLCGRPLFLRSWSRLWKFLSSWSHVSYVKVVEETAELPQLQFLAVWTGCCMPVGVQRLVVDVPVRLRRGVRGKYLDKVVDMPVGVSGTLWFIRSRSSSTRSWRRGLMSCTVDFLGPCTQVQGRRSCPQGHGPHGQTCVVTHRSAPQPPQQPPPQPPPQQPPQQPPQPPPQPPPPPPHRLRQVARPLFFFALHDDG